MTPSINLGFVFAIFFLTLGPMKLIPTFYGVTQGLDRRARLGLALRSTGVASVVLAAAVVVGTALATNWRVSREAMTITGGFLLLVGSLRILSQALSPAARPVSPDESVAEGPIGIVISPLAIPGIITPWGLVALLLFTGIAEDQNRLAGVVVAVLLIMALNIVGMIFAGPIMRTIGLPAMSVLGWVFSILQAALGVTFLLRGLVGVLGLPWSPTPL